MASLTTTPIPQPTPPRQYVLTLDADEAQMIYNILGSIGKRQYEDLRTHALGQDRWKEYSEFPSGSYPDNHPVRIIGRLWSVLHTEGHGLIDYNGREI